jgi:hypothetical protein
MIHLLRTLLAHEFTVSKRTLGMLLTIAGIVGFIGVLAVDIIDVGREGGIGPAQRLALAGCVGITLVGLTLIPLGDDPA